MEAYAGLRKRAAAFAIDLLLIAAYVVILAGVSLLLLNTTAMSDWMRPLLIRNLVAFLTLILPVVLYFSLMESSSKQATFGKQKGGIKVISDTGGRLHFGRALLRSALKFLPWQIAHTSVFLISAGDTSLFVMGLSILAQLLVIIYVLSIWLNKRHRAPYDWAARSDVVVQ